MHKYLFLTLPLFLLADPIEEIDRFTQNALAEWKVPGCSIVVVEGDKILLSKGYGVLEIGKDSQVDADTLFQLASITKTFTAAALAVQVDEGKLSFDEAVINHLPQAVLMEPYATRFVNARDLLAHRTGLPAFRGDLLGKLGYDNSEILRRIRFIEPASSFRDESHYSNVGFFIAGELLASLAKTSWEEAVQKTLLAPLKMERSGFNPEKTNSAKPHAFINGKLTILDWDKTGGFPAAGAVCSTANDMGKWMALFLSDKQKLLKPETVQELFTSAMASKADFSEAPPIDFWSGYDFTLGWGNFHYNGVMIVEKGGALDGIRTVTTLIPQKKLGITVLCNLNLTLFPEAVRAKFLEEMVGKGKNIQERIRGQQQALDNLIKPDAKPENPLPPRSLDLYAGDYTSELYGTFKVVVSNDALKVQAGPAAYAGTLVHFSNDTFLLNWPTVNSGSQKITFTFGPEGKATEFQTETLGTFRSA